ncbi:MULTISPECIES: RpiR family transcriptional regulator [unclassified Paraburkholderia]|uniref:RpiR family transcriptional regulator n=1 Tax=unclassified Paraburkholderia TaxID=2615204 RepID=UPI002AAFA53F|nr:MULTISPECIES: RpiR family transcriptional regulator [unclassified Paraburkholderia]
MIDPHHSHRAAGQMALSAVHSLFRGKGWEVEKDVGEGEDLVLTSPHGQTYFVQLKAISEGRADRVIPLFSQALLESRVHANEWEKARPAVILWVGSASKVLIDKLRDFHCAYGDDEPIAILSDEPLYVDFPGLKPVERPVGVRRTRHSGPPALVFSDLAQWMLKLLLAPEIKKEELIAAPAKTYQTATELAREADVSVMTATRLINALKEEGFVEFVPHLRIVQRRKLAQRWKASYVKPTVGVPMKFIAPGVPAEQQLRKTLKREMGATLGQFAAAHALGVGHVHGTGATVWIPNLGGAEGWRGLRRGLEGERPDLMLKQHPYPQSLLRGRVLREGVWVSDVIQTWLDVSADATRGAEQAAELEHGVLANIVGESV